MHFKLFNNTHVVEQKIYSAAKIFTGEQDLENHAIVVSNNFIEAIVSIESLHKNADQHFDIIAPAFIDIQIYGAHKKLLSVYPEADAIFKLNDYCKTGGALHFMATVATNSYEVIFACIDAIKDYWHQGGTGCLGLHVEGPWINPIKKGAHLSSYIHPPTKESIDALLNYGKGVIQIITLAPEICEPSLIQYIQSQGVIVSAGHSNASYQEATDAFNAGIQTATHLFNAMSPLEHRAPGMVGAIFNHPTTMCSIVPDGYHVNFEAIKIAKKQLGNRLFVITDAVTETATGAYPHQLMGDKYESNGILSGSALTMAKAVKNLVEKVGIPLNEALRMASLYPAQVIKKHNALGSIKVGLPANLVCLNNNLTVEKTITAN
ncbi:MAG: N-acetylglucosamine-6-phosphate deacetylase [Sediminibacterium sp.]